MGLLAVPVWGLFLGNLGAPERDYLTPLLPRLMERYSRLIEPAAGSFAVATIARHKGWASTAIDTSDVSLYSTAIGEAIVGRDLMALGVTLDGDKVELTGSPAHQAAEVLMLQLALRNAKHKQGHYLSAVLEDLESNREHHLASIQAKIEQLASHLGPITYRPLDMFDHLDEVADDPSALVVLNPPTYKCLGPYERLLTSDLRWVPCGDLVAGDQLLSFDEHADGRSRREPGARRRHWKLATVTRSEPAVAECVRVELASGESVVCTVDHPWLSGRGGQRKWIRADSLMLAGKRGPAGDGRYVFKAFDPWEPATSYEAGWLAGMFDGEGFLSYGPASTHLGMSQVAGPVADRIESWLLAEGIKITVGHSRSLGPLGRQPMSTFDVLGGFAESVRVLGTLRPLRLLNNFAAGVESRAVQAQPVRVLAVVPLGRQVIQSISTSTGTYIGEGYLMHNSGYEKFFDTGGRLTWDEPPYRLFDPKTGVADLLESVADVKALVVCLQQAPNGEPAAPPVYARMSTGSESVYYLSNRPGEVLAATGGIVARRRKTTPTPRMPGPILPPDHEITADSTCGVLPISTSQATHLKELWVHRIKPGSAALDVALIVDGHLAAVAGYDVRNQPTSPWAYHLLLLYTFAAPHPMRLLRLLVAMCCQRSTLDILRGPAAALWVDSCHSVLTVMLSKHPEVKTQRGLMKLEERRPDKDHGYRLYYSAPIETRTPAEVFDSWYRKEVEWQKSRRPKSPASK